MGKKNETTFEVVFVDGELDGLSVAERKNAIELRFAEAKEAAIAFFTAKLA